MKHRLFLSIELPTVQLNLISKLQLHLDGLGLPVDWEPEEKLHLTLNFIGRLDNTNTASIQKTIAKWINSLSGFRLSLKYLETLYNRHEPSLVYLAPTGDIDQLKELQQIISTHLIQMLIPQPTRFLPHVTIGKFKRTDPTTTKKFIDIISDQPDPELPSFRVETLVLYESYLTRAGSHYQKIRTYKLA